MSNPVHSGRYLSGVVGVVLAMSMTACDGVVKQVPPQSGGSVSPSADNGAAGTRFLDAQCADGLHQQRSAVPIAWQDGGEALTGPHEVTVLQEPELPGHTVYRPSHLPDEKLPVVAWGNGGCSANGLASAEFLAEIASHGYLVISNGVPDGSGEETRDGSTHIAALDWATNANADSCGTYFNRLDISSTAVMGYSCGGLMALNAAGDSRVSTVVALNSGLLAPDQDVYSRLHTPLAYLNGGEEDIAYENGLRDYQLISHVPVYHANLPVGHGGTYDRDNGGEYARVGVAWLNWHLKGDDGATGKQMFIGKNCGICGTDWVIEHKNF